MVDTSGTLQLNILWPKTPPVARPNAKSDTEGGKHGRSTHDDLVEGTQDGRKQGGNTGEARTAKRGRSAHGGLG